jgi:uncharacterized membrane protein YuzA (DUF378 family)
MITNHVFLDLLKSVILIIGDFNWHFIGIVVQVYETIVQEESAVTLFAIAIIDLLSTLNVFHSFYDEPLLFISISPRSLSRPFMIEHVGISYKAIGLYSFNLDTEDSRSYHHSNF